MRDHQFVCGLGKHQDGHCAQGGQRHAAIHSRAVGQAHHLASEPASHRDLATSRKGQLEFEPFGYSGRS